MMLSGKAIEWASEWVYLGLALRSSKSFDCSITDRVKKFYRCMNSIFRIEGMSNDMVMLCLIETHCVPLLTYTIEVGNVLNHDERRQLRVAYNSVFSKIFNYRCALVRERYCATRLLRKTHMGTFGGKKKIWLYQQNSLFKLGHTCASTSNLNCIYCY